MKNFKSGLNSNITKWLLITLLIVAIYNIINISGTEKKLSFSDFLNRVSNGEVREVSIRGNSINGIFFNGDSFATLIPNSYPRMIDDLRNHNVRISILPLESPLGSIIGTLFYLLPTILLIGFWVYAMRNMQGAGTKAMGFGKTKAKFIQKGMKQITFKDVAGVDEAKQELEEIVEFLKDPSKFGKLGGKIPRGCLLVGPPGTGKTLLAKAVAGEAEVPFVTISGSDFVEMFVGIGASRVRDMFAQAKKNSPCIIFIDEIDAVGRHRGAGLGGGSDEREQTLNQLLVEMDGFTDNQGVIVIAATNRPDVLDPALLRPGRFDRQITVPVPDVKGRNEILRVHIKSVPVSPNVNTKIIARGTPGFSGADLANLVNEAALLAARSNQEVVTMKDLEHAKDKVMMGPERKSMVMSEEDKRITAYHEGGHALIGLYMPESDPIHKATIMPRGRSLGMVMQLPENDQHSHSKVQLETRLAILMGGRVAEEITFGKEKITTGASNDIKVATDMARNMVAKWGLSEKIGPIMIGDDREEIFLGYSMGKDNKISNQLAEDVDNEINRLLKKAYSTAKGILTKNKKKLGLLAEALIQYETLTGEEIQVLMAGKKISKEPIESPKDKKEKDTVSTIPAEELC